ncbi:MAG: MlaD family protein, partial [Terrimicrobiaceae bacterium]
MSSEDRGTQIKVGIFILIGLVTVGLMVVYFGRLGEGLANYYNVRVEFSNASGLLRGSEVLLAGAKVGRVTNPPTILPD